MVDAAQSAGPEQGFAAFVMNLGVSEIGKVIEGERVHCVPLAVASNGPVSCSIDGFHDNFLMTGGLALDRCNGGQAYGDCRVLSMLFFRGFSA